MDNDEDEGEGEEEDEEDGLYRVLQALLHVLLTDSLPLLAKFISIFHSFLGVWVY